MSNFKVKIKLPKNVTRQEMANYIFSAVAEMSGCKHPSNPLFALDTDDMVVSWTEEGQTHSIVSD